MGNASTQWPLSASEAACSTAAGLPGGVLLETCATEEVATANATQTGGASLDNIRDIHLPTEKGQTLREQRLPPSLTGPLIIELKRKLDLPCWLRSSDQSKGGAGEVIVRVAQLHVIESVDEVTPELEVLSLR
jgi:hypothetical protein